MSLFEESAKHWLGISSSFNFLSGNHGFKQRCEFFLFLQLTHHWLLSDILWTIQWTRSPSIFSPSLISFHPAYSRREIGRPASLASLLAEWTSGSWRLSCFWDRMFCPDWVGIWQRTLTFFCSATLKLWRLSLTSMILSFFLTSAFLLAAGGAFFGGMMS